MEERIHVGESKLVLRASGLNGRAGKTFVYLLPGQVVKKVTVLPWTANGATFCAHIGMIHFEQQSRVPEKHWGATTSL